ncbi:hypothetical protein GCM10012287_44120 [Streptomyces daqingensis]|uniref:Uncharacterized protein n=1 Tax=Streptomyces daqingensis TaxID=1472640 RepID=A0ABQ2MMS1_9ACTN|nr:hypothetical protein [Streptomyces daqingensis]GGO54659.1 hypothetical protein GCM10012287_44120 [Streptomyces daqingensis]
MDARATSPAGGEGRPRTPGEEPRATGEQPRSAGGGPDGSGEAPRREPGQGPRQEPDGNKRYLRILFAVYAALLTIAFCVAVWAQRVEHDFAAAVTALGAVFLLVPTVEVAAKRDERHDTTQHRLEFLKALTTAVLVAGLVWFTLAALPEDVTRSTELKGGQGLRPGGTAQLTVDAKPRGHDELSVTLAARDETAGATSCLPGSRLEFGGEDLARPVTVRLAGEVTAVLPLDAAGPGVDVDVTLLADDGCQLTLTGKQARYK